MSRSATLRALALLGLFGTSLVAARAQIYTESVAYTSADSNTITGYDWYGNDLYYETATPDYNFGGLYKNQAALPVVAGSNTDFAGTSVVTIGNYVYYNMSTVNAYNPGTGTAAVVSSATNYALFGHNGSLYISGSPDYVYNHLYTSTLNSDGTLATAPIDFEIDGGASGPLVFDSAGDLIYAPGAYNPEVLEWSAAQVAAALASVTNGVSNDPLTVDDTTDPSNNAKVLYDYSSAYPNETGGTSMLLVGNKLLLTLTNFEEPSDLLSFTLNPDGSLSNPDLVLTTSDALGELDEHNGSIYVADGDNINKLTLTPEPSTWLLLVLGGAGLVLLAQRRRTPALLAFAVAAGTVPAAAGPYSPAGGQPGSTGIAAGSSSFVEWANDVVSFTPGPTDINNPTGPVASYGTASNALGPSDATAASPYSVVSLGDGGSIILSFAQPIANGPGADFAVFENGFAVAGSTTQYYLELATVEVSSNGVDWFGFPSVSLTQTQTQVAGIGAGDTLDPTNLYDLAGSQPAGYGTPFDLNELDGISSSLLNLNDITEVKITDVIGNIVKGTNSAGQATYTEDSEGNVINDPFPTDFPSGGFDLDAVGVVNVAKASPEPSTWLLLAAGLGALLVAARFQRA